MDDQIQLDKDIDLYKFYLEFLLKMALFVFGITGAMLSFFFLHKSKPLIVYSLLLPLIMNVGFSLVCFSGAPLAEQMDQDHRTLCDQMNLSLPYDMSTLPRMTTLFAVMYAMIASGLTILVLKEIF